AGPQSGPAHLQNLRQHVHGVKGDAEDESEASLHDGRGGGQHFLHADGQRDGPKRDEQADAFHQRLDDERQRAAQEQPGEHQGRQGENPRQRAKPSSWVMTSTAGFTPARAISRRMSWIKLTVLAMSKPAVGSSSTSRSGGTIILAPSTTRAACPTLNKYGDVFNFASMPRLLAMASARSSSRSSWGPRRRRHHPRTPWPPSSAAASGYSSSDRTLGMRHW